MSKRKRGGVIMDLSARLEGLFSGRGPEFLWDASSCLELLWPSRSSKSGLEESYMYVGREKAQDLFNAVMRLTEDNVMQILGAKGSGKSTVAATIAAYLHGSGERNVVFISGHHFASAPVYTLREALLLCFSRLPALKTDSDQLLEMNKLGELVNWCTDRGLLFMVDDWDKVEKKDSSREALEEASRGNILVKISSVNSRERYVYETTDKAGDYIRTHEFDGPYTQQELRTWMARSDLPEDRLAKLDYFTGGMPTLVRFYAEAEGDKEYMKRTSKTYTNKLASEMVSRLTNKESLEDALRLVTSHAGIAIPLRLEGMRLTCFFKRGFVYHILCPYLRYEAEQMLVSAGSVVEKKLLLDDLQVWFAAVQADLRAPAGSRNPARIGWNVEGLTIASIRVQGQVLPAYPFQLYVTYPHGEELETLSSLKYDVLARGVLLGPAAFNEKAVDIVYVILRNGVIEFVGIQITVAQWKARESKGSHEPWRKEVFPKWKEGLRLPAVEVKSTFLCVMPENVKLEDVTGVEAKRFGDICPNLRFLDALGLEPPNPVKKAVKRKCQGVNRDGKAGCGNMSTCPQCGEAESGFCECAWYCYHHRR